MVRVVASISPAPEHLSHVTSLVYDLLRQVTPFDKIYINIPRTSLKRGRGRGPTTQFYVPGDLQRLMKEQCPSAGRNKHTQCVLHLERCNDDGGLSKLLPVLELEIQPETLIMTIDDSLQHIHPSLTKCLLKKARQYPDAALGLSGWCYDSFPFALTRLVGGDQQVDWLEKGGVVLYKRGFFKQQAYWADIRAFALEMGVSQPWEHDDHVLSSYLASRRIARMSVSSGKGVDGPPLLAPWPLTEARQWLSPTDVWLATLLKFRGLYHCQSGVPLTRSIGFAVAGTALLSTLLLVSVLIVWLVVRARRKQSQTTTDSDTAAAVSELKSRTTR